MKGILAKIVKKKKLFITAVAVIVLGLGVAAYMIIGNATAGSATIDPPKTTINQVLGKPTDKTVEDLSPKENLYIAHGELLRAGSFDAISNGSTVSAGVEQKVYSRRVVKGNVAFKESVSSSSMVNVGSQRMVRGNSYVIRPAESITALDNVVWSGTASRVTESAFNDRYGCRGDELSSYILNDETILNARYDGYDESTGLYSFTYELDNVKATYYILHEMRTNAGTKKFPAFEKAVVTVTMNADWQVYSFSTDCVYKVALFGGVSCVEHLTEIFGSVGTVTEVPEYEFFESYFDAEETGGEVDKDPDALGVLAELFAKPLADGKINAAVEATVLGEPITINASVGIDMKASDILASLTADVGFGNSFVRYDGDGITVKYGDLAARTTVNEIKSLVAAFADKTASEKSETKGGLNASEILSSIEMRLGDDDCTLTIPLDLGGIDIKAVITGKAEGDGDDRAYTFAGATVTVGDYVTANVKLVNAPVEVPDLSGAASLGKIFDKIKSGRFDLAVSADKFDATATLDLNRKYLGVKAGKLTATLTADRALVKYGNAAFGANFADLKNEEFIGKIESFVSVLADKTGNDKLRAAAGTLGSLTATLFASEEKTPFDVSKIDVAKILGVLRDITAVKTDDGVVVSLATDGANVSVTLAESDGAYEFGSINAEIGADGKAVAVSVYPATESVEPIEETEEFVDAVALADVALPAIEKLVAATGYEIGLDSLALNLGGKTVTISGKAVYDGSNLRVNAIVKAGGKNFLKADVYLVDGTLYGEVNGVCFAAKISENAGGKKPLAETLDSLKGYNDSLDEIIAAVEELVSEPIDYENLIRSLAFDGKNLAVSAFLGGFGTVNAAINFGDELSVSIVPVTVGSTSVSLDATVKPSNETITAPTGDYSTRLTVNIDEKNSVFARLDFIRGEYDFLVTDPDRTEAGLGVKYAFDALYIKYGETLVRGDVAKIKAIIADITEVAKEQFGDKLQSGSLDALKNIDVKAIVRSISLDCTDDVTLSVQAFGFNATATADENFGLTVTVPIEKTRKVIGENGEEVTETYVFRTLTVTAGDGGASYAEFDENADYTDVATVFDEYFDVMVGLVKTNGWKFTVSAELAFGGNEYKIANAPVDFVYYGKDDFAVKVAAIVQKKQNGTFADAFAIEAAFTGGRVYVTYNDLINPNSSLKLSVSKEVLAEIVTELLPGLREVVPQLDDVLNESKRAMTEAFGSDKIVSLAEILKNVSYKDNELNIRINGSVLIGRLGDIDLTVSRHGENGLKASLGDLTYYDDETHAAASFALRGFTATAQAVEINGDGSESASIANVIGTYNDSDYINLDSLSALVRSFIITAKAKNDDGSRTFRLTGTIPVHLTALSIVNADVNLGVDARIDVKKDADGKDVVFVAVKISRGNLDGSLARVAFKDLGGDSYIYYNGEAGTITVARDSYTKHTYCSYKTCKKWGCTNGWHTGWHKNYVKLDSDPEIGNGSIGYKKTVTPEQFGSGMVDYLMNLINFIDSIKNAITDSMQSSHDKTYGIDDIITGYGYANSAYAVNVTLNPIDSVLGTATINVHHDADYKLTRLTGSIDILKITGVTCKGSVDISLVDAPYGDAERFAKATCVW